MQDATLYEQIGGAAALEAAVEVFYDRVLRDPLLAPFFTQTDVKRLTSHQKAFLTLALRGSGSYNGRSMRAAHQGRGITDAHFDRVATHLAETLASLGVSEEHVGAVIGTVAGLRGDIVEAGGQAAAA